MGIQRTSLQGWEQTLAKAYEENNCRNKRDFANVIQQKQQEWQGGPGHVAFEDRKLYEAVNMAKQSLRKDGLAQTNENIGAMARQDNFILHGLPSSLESFQRAASPQQPSVNSPNMGAQLGLQGQELESARAAARARFGMNGPTEP